MMTDTRPNEAASIEEAEAFLAKHPDISAFDLVLIDPNGIARGKIIRRHELLGLYKSGRHLPGSILGLDVTGEDVDETGLVWDDGDADRIAWPIAGSLVELPWTSPNAARSVSACMSWTAPAWAPIRVMRCRVRSRPSTRSA